MEPATPPPSEQHPPSWHARWQRLRQSWRLWVPFLPPALYVSGLILHVGVNGAIGSLLNVAMYAFYATLLAPLILGTLRANPCIWRLRVMRRILAGSALSIVAMACLAVTSAISGQSNGAAQVILVVITFGGFCFVFLALFVGLLDASKSVIERYRSEHSGANQMRS